jgi:hypothetical protein
VDVVDENPSEWVLKSPSPGGMDTGRAISNGLTDSDKLPDDADEGVKTKQKTPKMYLGSSMKTLQCHEKACKELASWGYHDVFSFMALKEKENVSWRGDPGDGGCTDCSLPGGDDIDEE